MTSAIPGTTGWLDQVVEDIIEPDLEIVDPHHHLWRRPGMDYVLEDLWADTGSGHNITQTVFVECGAEYLNDGPEELRCVGETQFVTELAEASRATENATIAGIVSRANLLTGDHVEAVLLAHEAAAHGLFRGIRHAGASDSNPAALSIPGKAPPGLYMDPDFRRGMKRLGELGYSFDAWHYHHQIAEFTDLARSVPETTMVLDHFGTPLGVGSYASQREAIFESWRADITELAKCSNVVAKLGGLAMPDNGFGWDQRTLPADSDELVDAQRRYYLHTIEAFGPERCMFESNFPVDKRSLSYPIYWNAMKKLSVEFSAAERAQMFADTARRVYRL